jgi:hypothetical protein
MDDIVIFLSQNDVLNMKLFEECHSIFAHAIICLLATDATFAFGRSCFAFARLWHLK